MGSPLTPRAGFRDAGLLIGRVLLGVVLVAHGWQKFTEWTIAGTVQSFGEMGVPLPGVAAPIAAAVELLGGALLILGLATPIVGVLVAIQMLVAAIVVHVAQGIFVGANGWELVGVIGALALVLAATGAGRFSLDRVFFGRRGKRAAEGAGNPKIAEDAGSPERAAAPSSGSGAHAASA